MKYVRTFIISILLAVAFFGCREKKNNSSTASEKSGFKKPSVLILFDAKIQKLVLNEEGILRGIDFDMSLDDVRKTDNSGNFTEVKNGLKTRIDLGDGTFAEVTFYKKNGERIGHISADVYSKDERSAAVLMNQYTAYLDLKYGAHINNEDGAFTWEIPGGHHISVGKFKDGEETGIEIESF